MKIETNYPLASETTFKCGGRAKYYVEVADEREFVNILKLHSGKMYILGAGSKTLCSDNGFDGLVISTKKLNKIWIENGLIVCESGVKLFELHNFCAENGLSGLEWSYGIPASIGGMAVMNAGAFSHEFCEFIEKVEVFEGGKIKTLNNFEITFAYRESSLKNIPIIKIYLKLANGKKSDIINKQQEYFARRLQSQPQNVASAGSVFKRVANVVPAQLIDSLGLKGLTLGGAMISEKHAGFIVNTGKATAKDVVSLIHSVKNKVHSAYGIDLVEEIIIIE